jgi:hypothetical protein
MLELYWLTRLDALNTFLCVVVAVLCAIFVILFIICIGSYVEESEKSFNIAKKYGLNVGISLLLSSLLLVFIPTKNDMFLIYGLGGTIDYIKSNDKIQSLPDKCVDALDAWVESLNIEKLNK